MCIFLILDVKWASFQLGEIMSVEDKVKKIVSDQLGTAIDEIQSDSSFVDDLGADSLDTVNEAVDYINSNS